MTAILEGVRIVSLVEYLPAAAGYILGDLGADVIKVERPRVGDGYRGSKKLYADAMSTPGGRHIPFEIANRNQRSITLDLKTAKGRDLLYKIVDKSDVFYSNFPEDDLRALGADYETMSARRPSLVYVMATAFGSEGPLARQRAFDFTIQAYSGFMFAMGDRDSGEPTQCVAMVIDTMQAVITAQAILAALLAKERFGIGQKVETSLLGSALLLQGIPLSVAAIKHRGWARHSRSKTKSPLMNYYKCADGKWLALTEFQADRHWPEIVATLGLNVDRDPRFTNQAAIREHARELIQVLDQKIAERSRDEWLTLLRERQVKFSYAPVNQYEDIGADAQLLANKYLIDVDHPTEGKLRVIGHPVKFDKTPLRVQRVAPELGQHTEEILTQLCACTPSEVATLAEDGIV